MAGVLTAQLSSGLCVADGEADACRKLFVYKLPRVNKCFHCNFSSCLFQMLSFDMFDTMDDAFFDIPPEEAHPQQPNVAGDNECTEEEEHALDTPMPSPHGSFCHTPLDFMETETEAETEAEAASTHHDQDRMHYVEEEVDTEEEDAVVSTTQQDLLQLKAQTLLSKKENEVESFIREFAALTNAGTASADNNDPCATTNMTTTSATLGSTLDLLDEADEQAFISQCSSQLADASLLLSHKYGTVFKEYLSRQQQQQFTQSYSQIPKNIVSKTNLCHMYAACFRRWIHSEHVSFNTANQTALGGLSPKDSFIFHLFSMATCRRIKGDDCFALSVVGRSSVGKTRMIEHVLQQASFTYASEPGCGRFNVKDRPILLYRDIDIEKLYKGADAGKFRTICRSEMTAVKIHSSTIMLPPLWVLVSANQRIINHTFQRVSAAAAAAATPVGAKRSLMDTPRDAEKKIKLEPDVAAAVQPSMTPSTSNAFNWATTPRLAHSAFYRPTPYRPCQYPSQLVDLSKKVNRQEESVKAVQNRVLELFVKDKPDLTQAPLPNGVIFQRTHLVVGIFDQIVDLLQQHLPDHFYSPVLLSYVLTGLCDNYQLFKKNWANRHDTKQAKEKLKSLISLYVPDVKQQHVYLSKLTPGHEKL